MIVLILLTLRSSYLGAREGDELFRTEGVKTGISFVDCHTVKVLKSASLTTFTLSLFHHL